eukprot:1705375-Amphidinium_carterae.3
MQIDDVTRDAIIEGSKPGYMQNTLIQAGMERGSAVGTAGGKLELSEEDNQLQFASPRRPDILFMLKELGRGLARPTQGHWKLMKACS